MFLLNFMARFGAFEVFSGWFRLVSQKKVGSFVSFHLFVCTQNEPNISETTQIINSETTQNRENYWKPPKMSQIIIAKPPKLYAERAIFFYLKIQFVLFCSAKLSSLYLTFFHDGYRGIHSLSNYISCVFLGKSGIQLFGL